MVSFCKMKFKTDCRFFKGERPCAPYKLCNRCPDYKPMGKRILIIKLGATGDVLRTTPLLAAIKKKYTDSFITWLTFPEAEEVLKFNPLIDCLLVYNLGSILRLERESFDLVLSLDKMAEATALVTKIKGREKRGFYMGDKGELLPLNKEADYAYRLGLDDKLKFKQNKKSYQEMIFEIAGLPYEREEYILNLTPQENDYTGSLRKRYRLHKKKVVGLNTGCGKVFDTKKWTIDGFVKVAKSLNTSAALSINPEHAERVNKHEVATLILGGPEEVERNKIISKCLKGIKGKAISTGCCNTLRQFISIIDLCDVVVTGDTIALHLAIALKKKVIALFGSTSSNEIDLYGRGEKLIGHAPCSPCYKSNCDKDKGNICMSSITPEMVLNSIKKLL